MQKQIKLNIKNFCYYTNSIGHSFDYKVYLHKGLKKVSFWHDINYKDNHVYNMVVEIPRGNLKKLEMSKDETYNPILQDRKINKITNKQYLRYYKLTPFFNYGFIPQTWENNNKKILGDYCGDNDPIDIIELSNKIYKSGDIIKVRILGGFCLIDEGEIDWKILALNGNDIGKDEANEWLNNSTNIELVKKIQYWFKVYKTYEGKPENIIYENDRIFNVNEIVNVIEENHEEYKKLISTKI